MSNPAAAADRVEPPRPSLFQAALAERWHQLPAEVQAMHGACVVERFSGTAQITRGSTLLARFAAWLFGFPPAAENVALIVTKTRSQTGEIWERNFGGRILRSYLTKAPSAYRYRERLGPFTYELDLSVQDGCMRLPVRRGWCLGMPIPRFLLPTSASREYAQDGVFHFDVALSAPLGCGLIVRYRGQLQPDRWVGSATTGI